MSPSHILLGSLSHLPHANSDANAAKMVTDSGERPRRTEQHNQSQRNTKQLKDTVSEARVNEQRKGATTSLNTLNAKVLSATAEASSDAAQGASERHRSAQETDAPGGVALPYRPKARRKRGKARSGKGSQEHVMGNEGRREEVEAGKNVAVKAALVSQVSYNSGHKKLRQNQDYDDSGSWVGQALLDALAGSSRSEPISPLSDTLTHLEPSITGTQAQSVWSSLANGGISLRSQPGVQSDKWRNKSLLARSVAPAQSYTPYEPLRISRGYASSSTSVKAIEKAPNAVRDNNPPKTVKPAAGNASTELSLPTTFSGRGAGDPVGVKPLPIPEPTAAYLLQASLRPRTLPFPQPLFIVIDLNGTLLYRPSRSNATRFVQRPFVDQFINHLLNCSAVMVWSSARPHNVEAMCKKLFTPQQRGRLVAVWGRDRLGLTKAQYDSKLQVYKRLSVVWQEFGCPAEAARQLGIGHWGQHNTVLLDDSALKASSEPHNVVVVPEFMGNAAGAKEQKDGDDSAVLKQVAGYLQNLAYQADVSAYIRQTPFAVGGGWERCWPGD